MTGRLAEFNNEAMRDVYGDLLGLVASFGGQIFGVSNKMGKRVCDSFGAKEVLLAHQLCKGEQFNILREHSN